MDPSSSHQAIRRAALLMLARRDHSQHEITQKLIKKGYAKNDIEPIIQALVEKGWINDWHFAEHYLHAKKQKGYGPERIKQEMQIKGIPQEIIAELIHLTDNTWQAMIHAVWKKHFNCQNPKDFKIRVKQMRFFQYRGFTQDQIQSLYKDHDITDE